MITNLSKAFDFSKSLLYRKSTIYYKNMGSDSIK